MNKPFEHRQQDIMFIIRTMRTFVYTFVTKSFSMKAVAGESPPLPPEYIYICQHAILRHYPEFFI